MKVPKLPTLYPKMGFATFEMNFVQKVAEAVFCTLLMETEAGKKQNVKCIVARN
jgi:hypothetical protein